MPHVPLESLSQAALRVLQWTTTPASLLKQEKTSKLVLRKHAKTMITARAAQSSECTPLVSSCCSYIECSVVVTAGKCKTCTHQARLELCTDTTCKIMDQVEEAKVHSCSHIAWSLVVHSCSHIAWWLVVPSCAHIAWWLVVHSCAHIAWWLVVHSCSHIAWWLVVHSVYIPAWDRCRQTGQSTLELPALAYGGPQTTSEPHACTRHAADMSAPALRKQSSPARHTAYESLRPSCTFSILPAIAALQWNCHTTHQRSITTCPIGNAIKHLILISVARTSRQHDMPSHSTHRPAHLARS
jgi:hypothetical protein